MSDDYNAAGSGAPVPESGAPSAKPKFLSTATGKLVAVLVGLGALGVIAGIVVAVVLYVFAGDAIDQLEVVTTPGTTETTEGSIEATASAGPSATAVPLTSIFTFRDIFEPLIKPLPTSSGSTTTTSTPTGGTTGGDTVTPTTAGTLYLNDIVTENSVLKAVLRLDGQTYTLGAGERIPNTPWQVLRVNATTVTMLYGDVQVTLAIGQGIVK